MTWMS
jgi:hypothetical protein